MAQSSVQVTFKALSSEEVYSPEQNYNLVVDLDPDMNGGKTSFIYGEEDAYIRVFKNPLLNIVEINVSDGSVTPAGSGTAVVEVPIVFEGTDMSSVSIPITEITGMNWKGNSLGNVGKVNPTTVKATSSGVGVGDLSYTADFDRYKVSLGVRSDPSWPVAIEFVAELA